MIGKDLRPGSSPLARGLQRRAPRGYLQARIIPARAGFTGPRRGRGTPPADHPRSRGVYTAPVLQVSRADGSSPLARGLHGAGPPGLAGRRIIPARAGFTRRPRGILVHPRDHPRSRGVYFLVILIGRCGAGSSPLARGLRGPSQLRVPAGRIIPARAGFTALWPCKEIYWWDHPRSRGVYAMLQHMATESPGSSPLARGLQVLHRDVENLYRIIPARAGFTVWSVLTGRLTRDHPRSRGVYGTLGGTHGDCYGSSPLARGLHLRILGIPTTSHTTRPRLPSLPT